MGISMDLLLPSIALYIFIFCFGITIGSFLNVCILRLPHGESLINGPSHCMTCGERIKPYDLIPLFSWLFLRGKCRNCGSKISPRYPIVEFLNGVVYVLVFMRFDFFPLMKPVIVALFCSALIVVAFMDWDTQEINLGVLAFIGLLSIPAAILFKDVSLIERGIGALIVSVPFTLIVLISKEKAMGWGDAVLMAAGGLFLGWKAAAVAGLVGIVVGAVAGAIIKYATKSSKFAFGPWLAIGLAVSVFYGNQIFEWYRNLITF